MRIRIGTYNLRRSVLDDASPDNNWRVRRPRLVQSILDNAFDVCGLQEVDTPEQESLPHLLAGQGAVYESYFFSPYAEDGKGTKAHGLIWRKDRFRMAGEPHFFWISNPPEKQQVNDLGLDLKHRYIRGGFCVVMENILAEREYFVMVTHAPLNTDQHAEHAHVFVEMEKRYNPNGWPSFFIGDFNACETDAPSTVYRTWWKDSFHYFDNAPEFREGPEGSFNGWQLDKLPERRIDFIYYKGEGVVPLHYRCNDTRYNGLLASDHFPIWVDFNIQ